MIITRSKLTEIQSAMDRLGCTARLERVHVHSDDLLGVRADASGLLRALPVLGRYLPPGDLQELGEQETGGLTVFLDIVVEDSFAFIPTASSEN